MIKTTKVKVINKNEATEKNRIKDVNSIFLKFEIN